MHEYLEHTVGCLFHGLQISQIFETSMSFALKIVTGFVKTDPNGTKTEIYFIAEH